jgi:hypothetical protein
VIARTLEQAGISTVGISLLREHTARVRPPRARFVAFPFGRALGKPNDPAFQHEVIAAALALLSRPESAKPILEDFPVLLDEEPEQDEPLACALAVPPRKARAEDVPRWAEKVMAEIAALRPCYEESRRKLDRTMVGNASIAPEEIERAARYLERFINGESLALAEKPADVTQVQYLRWCADDLKAFYLEAAVARQGAQPWTTHQLEGWLWRETALGDLIITVQTRIFAMGNDMEKAIAFSLVPALYTPADNLRQGILARTKSSL